MPFLSFRRRRELREVAIDGAGMGNVEKVKVRGEGEQRNCPICLLAVREGGGVAAGKAVCDDGCEDQCVLI